MTVPPTTALRRPLIIRTAASLGLAAIVVGIVLFSGGSASKLLTGRYLLTGLACLAPYLLVLILLTLQSRPSAVTLGLTSGLGYGLSWGLVVLVVVGTFGRVVVLLTMMSVPIVAGLLMGIIQIARWVSGMHPIALVMLIILGLLQFQVAKLAQQTRVLTVPGKSGQWTLGRVMAFAIFGVAAALAMSAQSHAETASVRTFIKSQEQQRAAGMDSYHTMLRIQVCAAMYADSVTKGEYPATLAAMGPEGSKCLDSAVVTGSISGYPFQFHPITDSSGRNVGWWAVSQRPHPQVGDNAWVADHTGALYVSRVGYYQPPDSNKPDSIVALYLPSYSDLGKWVHMAQCMRDAYARDTTTRGYPPDITGTESTCLGRRNRVVYGDYLLTYEAERPDGKGRFKSFVLHATPLHYGKEAVRSYLIDPDGAVSVTASQRRATAADPVYVGCESDNTVPCRIAGMN